MNRITQVCAAIALTLALSPTVFADPPADKGRRARANRRAKDRAAEGKLR